ncbi:protein rep [Laribacter hongkongensis]|uniref:protein rep n=1 Tax=Laribacter hongkongensis TaxID=168471 RepID=UPI001EFCACE6|nr:protein rep [Laribacter hongkongensis]MCG9116997.1 protein rep [Laribacter hongkongensis]
MAVAIDPNFICVPEICNNPERDGLTDFSPKDAPWDTHRAQAQDVGGIYAASDEFERYAARIGLCSGVLRFGWIPDTETGELALKLREARFCRVRHCPVCQWRRSLMWQARFLQSLPDLMTGHPSARWIFLTLTVRNCQISELADTLKAMNDAWNRLRLRKEFAPVLGWIRATEVTRGRDGSAHPHFHALLMVPPSMFTTHYVKQSRWIELWRDCARLDYLPVVNVKTVKAKPGNAPETALRAAVAETLKYSVKPDDMTADADWFLEMTRQVHKKRFIASGGALKDVLRVDDEADKDLALAGDSASAEDDGTRLAFNWREHERRYRRFKGGDV